MIRAPLLAAMLVLASGSAAAEEKAPMSRDRFLDVLAPVIHASVQRKDTTHAVFHGCYDWHSAVHGHWALLRLDRATGRHAAAARAVARRLRGKALDAERRLLVSKPAFEMPYGRAWFLRLALELEAWSKKREDEDAERLHPMADEVAASLRSWMDARRFDPATPEYGNHSWVAAQLHAWYDRRRDKRGAAAVRAWVAAWKPDPKRLPSLATDARRPEFFSLYGNWAYAVLETQAEDAARGVLAAFPPPAGALPPVEVPADAVHGLGMNWSRAWALRRLAAAAVDADAAARLRAAYTRHVEAGIRDHARHVGRYLAYDHWVPQFAVYALTEEP